MLLALALGLVPAVGGCAGSMTRRDEFYLIRGLTFQPRPGDGSVISVGREQDVLREVANAGELHRRGMDLDR